MSPSLTRRLAKVAIADVAYHSGALWAIEHVQHALRGQARVLVLSYHRVVADFARAAATDIPALSISRDTFAVHLEFLRRHYDVVTLREAVAAMRGTGTYPRPVAALTFDDGYGDVYEHAFPILRRLGVPATVFLATGYVDTDRRLPHDRLHHLLTILAKQRELAASAWAPEIGAALLDAGLGRATPAAMVERLQARQPLRVLHALIDALCAATGDRGLPAAGRLLRWDEVIEMAHSGVEIGAHTVEHAILPHESPRRIAEELTTSKHAIESVIGREVTSFAYPDGRYDAAVVEHVAHAGYRIAVTTEDIIGERNTAMLQVPRKTLWENSSLGLLGTSRAVLASQLGHLYGLLRLQRPIWGQR